MEFIWIGKTNRARFDWGPDGNNSESAVDRSVEPEHNSLLFRKEYEFGDRIKKAQARVCGLGLYAFYINGRRVGENVLTPLETNFRKRVLYDVYDIAALLQNGKNVLAVEVGNGRYSTPKKYWDWRAAWYGDPLLTVSVTVEYDDGRIENVSTDTDWKTADGARTDNCFYDGEVYDESHACCGWNRVGFDDSMWQNALNVPEPGGVCEENRYFSIRRCRTLLPKSVVKTDEGAFLYDFGENVAGWAKLRFYGEKGDVITIRYAERITDGRLDASSNEKALCTDVYKIQESGVKEYEPCFTLRGYSAIEVSSEKGSVAVEHIEGYAVHASLPTKGSFICSNEDLNRLHEVILRTQNSALMSYPIDCPQRDERLGWLGDAHVTDRVCLYNLDMRRYYEKWLADIRADCHSKEGYVPFIAPWHTSGHAADWSAAYGVILWDYYLFYRDRDILKQHVPALARYVLYLEKQGPILPRSRYGDWMSTLPDWKRGDPACCTTLFYYQNIVILQKIVTVLGVKQDYARFFALEKSVKEAIQKAFFDPKAVRFDDNSQFSVAFALRLGLIPEPYRDKMEKVLLNDLQAHDYHLTTGILGTKVVCEMLAEISPETAMRVMLNETYPGFLDLIRGKTTLSETWAGGRSQNHCMFGSVDELFYSMLCGIKIGENGVMLQPYFAKELTFVKGGLCLPDGEISIEWKRDKKDVYIEIETAGKTVVPYHDGQNDVTLSAGKHSFVFRERE